jgi:hypothetical protein
MTLASLSILRRGKLDRQCSCRAHQGLSRIQAQRTFGVNAFRGRGLEKRAEERGRLLAGIQTLPLYTLRGESNLKKKW